MTRTTHLCDQCEKELLHGEAHLHFKIKSGPGLDFFWNNRRYHCHQNELEFCNFQCFTKWIEEIPKRIKDEEES